MQCYACRDTTHYVIRLDRGEELLSALALFAAQQELPGATFTGIGAVRDSVLGAFNLDRSQYERRPIREPMELVSLTGNISWVEDQPLVHAHATLAGADLQALGGHLFSAVVAVTAEIALTVLDQRLPRILDPESGLNLLG